MFLTLKVKYFHKLLKPLEYIDDQWMMPVYATRDTTIYFNERIAQFRIVENQPRLEFKTVEHLEEENRGGFGSTGRC